VVVLVWFRRAAAVTAKYAIDYVLSSDGFCVALSFLRCNFDVRELGAREAILAAVSAKREHGGFARRVKFYCIGG
jgi:hypothetical protein